MYGTQASSMQIKAISWFENDVKMYGTQADNQLGGNWAVFENDVKMYGTQACKAFCKTNLSLRMM